MVKIHNEELNCILKKVVFIILTFDEGKLTIF